MTLRAVKCVWFFAWMILCFAALPSRVVEARHLVGAAILGAVIYAGRDRIFRRRTRDDPISRPRVSLVLAGFMGLGAWAGFGVASYDDALHGYRLSAFVAALGVTGFLLLDRIANNPRWGNS